MPTNYITYISVSRSGVYLTLKARHNYRKICNYCLPQTKALGVKESEALDETYS